jgi:hypothetical protein
MAASPSTVRPPPQLNPFYIEKSTLEDVYDDDCLSEVDDMEEIESLLHDESRINRTNKSQRSIPGQHKQQRGQCNIPSFRIVICCCSSLIIMIVLVWLIGFQNSALDDTSTSKNDTSSEMFNESSSSIPKASNGTRFLGYE